MGKRIFMISLFFLIILIVAAYSVYQYRSQIVQAQKINKQYEEYYNVEFLGTQLISIINKTMDLNEKNEIPKDDSGHFIDNEKNTIKIYVSFVYEDDIKVISMEDIAKGGTEAFINMYNTEEFKCTKIEYHEKTKNVKSLTFEEI